MVNGQHYFIRKFLFFFLLLMCILKGGLLKALVLSIGAWVSLINTRLKDLKVLQTRLLENKTEEVLLHINVQSNNL